MKISSSSQSVDRLFVSKEMDIFAFIKYAKEGLGLDAVEFEDKHFESTTPEYLKKVKDECAKYGLEVANIAFFNSFGYPTKEENEKEVKRATEWMDVATAVGSKNFRIFAGWMGGPNRDLKFTGEIGQKPQEAWDEMVACLKEVCKNAAAKGLNVVIENHNHGGFLSVSDDALRLFGQITEPNFSLLLDTGNFADGIGGIEKAVHLAKYHIHLKCREINEDGSDNAFDLDKILSVIKKSGYDGNISLEYEGEQDEKTYLPKLVSFVKARI